MESKNILVLGGKGKTGRRVVERLTQLGIPVSIGSRSETPKFDWERPETWENVLAGIDKVYITYQPDLAVPSALQAIKDFTSQAVKSGVKKLVLLSGRGEEEAQRCEQVVMNSGIDWTIVRADWFNQNFNESFFLEPILAGHLALPRAEALIPFVDVNDIAEVVVASLLDDRHSGKIHELTGPRLLSFQQVAEEISKATGREIQFHSVTLEEYLNKLREHQIPEDFILLINYLFTNVLDGRNASITHDIEKVLGRKAKDFTEYVNEAAKTGVWNSIE